MALTTNNPNNPAPPVETPWLTAPEAAQYLRVSLSTIRKACQFDKLRHARPGGRKLLFRRGWLDEWVAQKTFEPILK